ncbi:hypothetical protein ACFXJ8_12525 [Nonomuraea sp. NPDC059194]|uniref:hypothetical protein n=1 Tax=Nonomuraea sp. NPDC059194 TaxID=3346764 RepID=UPI0036A71A6A
MARLVRGLDDEVWLEFGLAILCEPDHSLVLDGDADDDLVRVRLEAWDAEPPAPDAPWIPVVNTTIMGGTGSVSVASMDEEATQSLLIGPPHFLYGVAAHTLPPAQPPDFTSEETWNERELARWLIRFWPIRDAFDPVRHARPDGGARREPREVEVPVSRADDWLQARISRREAAMEEYLAHTGVTMADYLAAHGLAPDLPFDQARAAMMERELPGVAARQGWPDWWTELVRKYPEIGDHWDCLSEDDPEWNPDRREESARALAAHRRTEEILNPDLRNTFSVDIPAYEPQPGATYRGWRWDYASRPADETFGVDRQVVFHDVMSGKVLVTGIVTVIGTERRQFRVRNAEPAEAARFRCAEATWRE